MRDAILRKARESARTLEEFFAAEAAKIEACARVLAERLSAGARIFTFGNGGSACDAHHLAVEFAHPIFEKRRAFPAVALGELPLVTAIANDRDFARIFADPLRLHARAGDVAVGLSTSGRSANVARAFEAARELGLRTVALTGGDGGRLAADFVFVVPSFAIHRIQETHGALLHVLWDCVHLALGEDDVV